MHAWGNPNQERPRGDTINGQLYAAESAGLRPAALGIQEVVEGTDAPTIAVAVGVAVAVAVAVAVVVVVVEGYCFLLNIIDGPAGAIRSVFVSFFIAPA